MLEYLRRLISPRAVDPEKLDTVDEVASAIENVNAEHARRSEEHAALRRRLDDDLLRLDDDQIAAISGMIEKTTNQLGRLEQLQPKLSRRLAELRTEAQRRAGQKLRRKYLAAATEFARAYRMAVETREALAQVAGEIVESPRQVDTAGLIDILPASPLRVLDRESLNRFETDLERAGAAEARLATPQRPSPAKGPSAAATMADPAPRRGYTGTKTVRLLERHGNWAKGAFKTIGAGLADSLVRGGRAEYWNAEKAKAAAAALESDALRPSPPQPPAEYTLLGTHPGPDRQGKAWIVVVRRGLPAPLKMGTLHHLDHKQAFALVENRACEFIDPPQPSDGAVAAVDGGTLTQAANVETPQ